MKEPETKIKVLEASAFCQEALGNKLSVAKNYVTLFIQWGKNESLVSEDIIGIKA